MLISRLFSSATACIYGSELQKSHDVAENRDSDDPQTETVQLSPGLKATRVLEERWRILVSGLLGCRPAVTKLFLVQLSSEDILYYSFVNTTIAITNTKLLSDSEKSFLTCHDIIRRTDKLITSYQVTDIRLDLPEFKMSGSLGIYLTLEI